MQNTHVLKGHGGPVRALDFAPGGELLCSVSDDGSARLWRLGGPEPAAGGAAAGEGGGEEGGMDKTQGLLKGGVPVDAAPTEDMLSRISKTFAGLQCVRDGWWGKSAAWDA